MNWRLLLLQLYLPGQLKRRQLLELHHRSAAALGCVSAQDCRKTKAGSCRQLLKTLATFTKDQARLAMAAEASPEVLSERLRREAAEMGRNLRKRLRLRTQGEFRTALKLVYRALGIDLRVSPSGEVLIRRCFFSTFYSAPVCRLMSSLDDGLVEGLSGGCRLRFTHRLTEGAPCCRAMIKWPVERNS